MIGKSAPGPSGRDKTSILVTGKDAPGLLYRILAPFEENGVNMTRLETRPIKGSHWTYQFFIDFRGHQEDPPVSRTLTSLTTQSINLRILGSYPQAPI